MFLQYYMESDACYSVTSFDSTLKTIAIICELILFSKLVIDKYIYFLVIMLNKFIY